MVTDKVHSHFYDENGNPKFLFYLTIDNLIRYQEWLRDNMANDDKRILSIIDQLPCRLPTREIVKIYLYLRSLNDNW